MFKRIFDYYGFFRSHKPVNSPIEVPALTANLLPTSNTLDQHMEFIKDTFQKEDERKETLEGKAGQLLGQAGLVLSLVGLITPLIADSLTQLPKLLLYTITGLFIAAVLFFTNSIFHASMLNKVLQWQYMRPSINNIFKIYTNEQFSEPAHQENQYKSDLIIDYYKSFIRNRENNNQKADFLNYAAYSFSTALIITSVLILFVCFGLTLKKDEPSKVLIVNSSPMKIKQGKDLSSCQSKVDSLTKIIYQKNIEKKKINE